MEKASQKYMTKRRPYNSITPTTTHICIYGYNISLLHVALYKQPKVTQATKILNHVLYNIFICQPDLKD